MFRAEINFRIQLEKWILRGINFLAIFDFWNILDK